MNDELSTLYNHKTLKIGHALKWRGVYSETLSYYRDNVVTMCSCVFWCKQLFVRDVPPLVYRSSDQAFLFANTDVWECLVDNLWLYNNATRIKNISDSYEQTEVEMQELIDQANQALGAYDDYIIEKIREELYTLRAGGLDIELHSTEGFLFRKGNVETILYAKILCNRFDVTDLCADLIHSYVWSGDTKNQEEDEIWARNAEIVNGGLGVRLVDNSVRNDLGTYFFTQRRKAKFTINVSVAVDDILTLQASGSKSFI